MGSDFSKLNLNNLRDCCCKDITDSVNKNCEREVENFQVNNNNSQEEKKHLVKVNCTENKYIKSTIDDKVDDNEKLEDLIKSQNLLKTDPKQNPIKNQDHVKSQQNQRISSSENDLKLSKKLKTDLEIIKQNSQKKNNEHVFRNSDSDSESNSNSSELVKIQSSLNINNVEYNTYEIQINNENYSINEKDKVDTNKDINKNSKLKIKNSKFKILNYDEDSKNSSKSSKRINININQNNSFNVNLKTGNLSNLKIRKLFTISGIGLSPFRQNSEKSRYSEFDVNGDVYKTKCDDLSENHIEFLKHKLKQTIPWLKHINDYENNIIQKVINKCVKYVCKEGEILYNDNEFGSQLYVIYSGKFGFFSRNNSLKAEYIKGNILGDINANNNKFELEKDWHVKCIYEGSIVFIIDSEDLMKIQNTFINNLCNKYINIFNEHKYLKYLSNFEKMRLSNEITIIKPKKNIIIQSVGQKVDCLYFIISGSVTEINLFGEIINEHKVNESINCNFCLFDYNSESEFRITNKETTLISISSSKLKEVLDDNFHEEIIFSIFSHVCKENEKFCKIIESFLIDSENIIYFNSNNVNTKNFDTKNRSHSIIVKDSKLSKNNIHITNKSINTNNNFSGSSNINSIDTNNLMKIENSNKNQSVVYSAKDANNNYLNYFNSASSVYNSIDDSEKSSSEITKEINVSSGIFDKCNNLEQIIDSNLHAKNIYRNVFEKFTLKTYLKGEKIYIYEEKKTAILIQGKIESEKNKLKFVLSPIILGSIFYENFM